MHTNIKITHFTSDAVQDFPPCWSHYDTLLATRCRHQSPEWVILSQVNCFVLGEVKWFQILLDSLHPRGARASWWSPPVLQAEAVKIFFASVSSGRRTAQCGQTGRDAVLGQWPKVVVPQLSILHHYSMHVDSQQLMQTPLVKSSLWSFSVVTQGGSKLNSPDIS